MKALLLISCLFPSLSWCQPSEFENFKIENNKLVWQKVYDAKTNLSSFIYLFSEIHQKEDSVISGRISKTNYQPFLKKINKNWGNTAIILWRSEYDATATIELKENRYRVTLSDIYHHYDEESIDLSGPEEETARKNNGDFRKTWINNIAPFLDQCFIQQFKVKEDYDDW